MFLKILKRNFIAMMIFFPINAIDFVELGTPNCFDFFSRATAAPLSVATATPLSVVVIATNIALEEGIANEFTDIATPVATPLAPAVSTYATYRNSEEGTNNYLFYFDARGHVDAVFEGSLSQPRYLNPEEEISEINQAVKISKIFYMSHAIANTFFLSGAFYKLSSEFLGVSAFYFCWCAMLYGASYSDTTKKFLEFQNSELQEVFKVLDDLSSFQFVQAGINLSAGACLFAGLLVEKPMLGYASGSVFLIGSVGNSFFFGCAN